MTLYKREPTPNEPAKLHKKSKKTLSTKQPKKNFSVCHEKANLKAKSTDKLF